MAYNWLQVFAIVAFLGVTQQGSYIGPFLKKPNMQEGIQVSNKC